MKKDYLTVTKKQKEIDFVEDFWTKRWNKSKLPELFHQVAKREEFKMMWPYLKPLSKKIKILDGGCGLGEWVLYLDKLGFKMTGLDISKKTIKRLKKKFPQQKFLVGDIRDTKLRAASFDNYFSWGTFEHFEEGLEKCFQEAYRVLKPGGLLFISVPFHNLRLILRDLLGLEKNDHNKQMRFYQWRLTKAELKQQLVMNGFRVMEINPIHKAHGLRQLLKHDFKILPKSLLHQPLKLFFYPFVSKNFTAHMLMAVAKKK